MYNVLMYTRYNEVSECKCLIRAIDSARQVSAVIDAKTQDGKEFNNQLLEECTDQFMADRCYGTGCKWKHGR